MDLRTIKVSVFDVNEKELFRNTVELPLGFSFPFENVISVLKLLYPKSFSIRFSVF